MTLGARAAIRFEPATYLRYFILSLLLVAMYFNGAAASHQLLLLSGAILFFTGLRLLFEKQVSLSSYSALLILFFCASIWIGGLSDQGVRNLLLAGMYLSLFACGRKQENLRFSLCLIAATGLLLSLALLIGRRSYVDPSHLANLLLLTLGATAFLASKFRVAVWIALPQLAAMFLLRSLGAWMALGLTATAITIRLLRVNARQRLLVGLTASVALVLGIAIFSKSWTSDGVSVAIRWKIWQATVSLWLEAPLFGHGLGSFVDQFTAFRPADLPLAVAHAHNDYLELLCEIGLFGVTLLLFPLVHLVRFVISKANTAQWLLFSGPCAFALHAGVDFPLFVPANAGIAFFMLGSVSRAIELPPLPIFSRSSIASMRQPWLLRLTLCLVMVAGFVAALIAAVEANSEKRWVQQRLQAIAAPISWNQKIQKGLYEQAMRDKNKPLAEAVLRRLAVFGSPASRFQMELAIALQRKGEQEEASQWARRAKQKEPNNPILLMRYASFMFAAEQTDDAIVALNQAVQIDPGILAKAFNLLTFHKRPLSEFAQVSPSNPDADFHLAQAFMKRGEFEQADTILWPRFKRTELSENQLLYYARQLSGRDKREEAIEIYQWLHRSRPNLGVLIRLAKLYSAEGNQMRARGLYEQGLCSEVGPALLEPWMKLLKTSMQREQGRALLEACLKQRPGAWQSYLLLGRFFREHKQPDMALIHLKKACETKPTDPLAFLELSDWYAKAGALALAIQTLERASQRWTRHIGVKERLADLYMNGRDLARARSLYAEILQIDPSRLKMMEKLRAIEEDRRLK